MKDKSEGNMQGWFGHKVRYNPSFSMDACTFDIVKCPKTVIEN
jgi:hypothetical protein